MKFRQGLMGRSALTVLMVVGSIAVPSFARAAESIVVEGNKRVDSETIRSYFVGGDTNEAIKKLYGTGYFSDVEVSHRGGALVVHVVENSTIINHVVFVGNSKVKSEQIEKEIQSKPRGGYNQATVDADVQRIEDVYRRAGRSGAKVSARTVQTPRGTVDVVFDIDEGEKTGIKEIHFVGNHVFSESRLLGLMETTEMNYLSFLKTSDVYDPDRLAKDGEAIRRYYLKNGYADFRLVGEDAVYDAAKGGYVVTITVEEGAQYTVSSVHVESQLHDVPASMLEHDVRVHKGDIYDGDAVQKSVERMSAEMSRRGYPFTQVSPRGERDPATHTVSLSFIAEEGPRVYIQRLNIRGNTATRDYVIRREFDIGEGDAYNKALIDKAERRLNSLGFFKKVKITNEAGDSADRIIVDVDVEEQSTGNFSVSGGYSTTVGILAEVSVTQSNLLGRGDYIRASVSAGQFAQGVELNYTEPFFLDQRLAAGFDLYSKMSDASPFAYYSNWVTGGTIRLGLPLTDEISIGPRYTWYNSLLTIPNNGAMPYNDCSQPIGGITPVNPAPGAVNQLTPFNNCLTNGEASIALKQAQGDWVTSMVGYTLSYNSLDNPRDPHGGIHAELKQDFAGVGGNSDFLRTTGDLRAYHELYFDNIVGVLHLQAGDILPFGNQPLRIVDNFNLGDSLVRGFAPGGIGPRDVTSTFYGNNWGNALGGTQYYGTSLEAQFPIWGLPRDIGLKGAIFADAGSLFDYRGVTNFASYVGLPASACSPANKQNTINAANARYSQAGCINIGGDSAAVRSSVGVGLIWASPMGPIRVNYATALTRSKADILEAFSFSGGANF